MQKKKNIFILGTGGTIAGVAENQTQTSGYQSATLSIDSILDAVPNIADIANIQSEQFCQIASENMNYDVWLPLIKRVRKLVLDDSVDGIVITHGTDTLEETAYLLHLTIPTTKPIVLVGAMRPATSISADGPLNLYEAVLVASHKDSIGKGVLVVMENIILSGREAQKTSTYKTNTFMGADYGTLGMIQNSKVFYYYQSLRKHTINSEFAYHDYDAFPKVDIVYLYVDAHTEILKLVIENGAKGIIIAGIGNGSFNQSMLNYIELNNLNSDTALPIVRSSRVLGGTVAINGEVDDNFYKTISANDLSPQKARILLTLALASETPKSKLQEIFLSY